MKGRGSLETFEISLGRVKGFLDYCPVRKGTMGKSGPEMGPKIHPGRLSALGWAGRVTQDCACRKCGRPC